MDYLYLGKIVDTHGIKGEVRILLKDFLVFDINSNSFINSKEVNDSLFIQNKYLYIGKEKEEVVLTSYRHHKIYEMVCFEGLTNINDVLKYKGEKCFVKSNALKENQILLSELISYKIDFNDEDYGKIVDYQNNNGNIIFEIDWKNKYFIPVNSNFILNIDKEKKLVKVQNIEGLII